MGNSIKVPAGKTKARLKSDVPQSELKKGDKVYIDGYVRGGNDAPLAAVVRLTDGSIDLCSIYQLEAMELAYG